MTVEPRACTLWLTISFDPDYWDEYEDDAAWMVLARLTRHADSFPGVEVEDSGVDPENELG